MQDTCAAWSPSVPGVLAGVLHHSGLEPAHRSSLRAQRCPAVDVVAKGKYIQVTHGHVDMHKGSMRLVVNDKGGGVEPAEADFEPKVGQALPLVLWLPKRFCVYQAALCACQHGRYKSEHGSSALLACRVSGRIQWLCVCVCRQASTCPW